MTSPDNPHGIPAGWYPDQNSGVLRYWDGEEWTTSTQPIVPSATPPNQLKRKAPVKWIAAAATCMAVLTAAGTALFVNRDTNDNDRWSKFPLSMACTELTGYEDLNLVPHTVATTVKQVTLTHEGEQKLALTVEFAQSVPPHPTLITSPYSGEQIFAPGTIDYRIYINGPDDNSGSALTALTFGGWIALRGDSDFVLKTVLGEETPDYSDKNLLKSFDSSGNTVRFVYDLNEQPGMFADGPYTPTVSISTSRVGPASYQYPDGVTSPYVAQLCSQNTQISTPPVRPQPAPTQTRDTANTAAAREERVAELLASHGLPFNLPVGPGDDIIEMDPSGMGASLCYQLKTNNLSFDGTTSILNLDQAHQWIEDVVTVYCPENITRIPW